MLVPFDGMFPTPGLAFRTALCTGSPPGFFGSNASLAFFCFSVCVSMFAEGRTRATQVYHDLSVYFTWLSDEEKLEQSEYAEEISCAH